MPRARTTTAEDIPVVAKKPRAPRTRRVVDDGEEKAPTVRRRKSVATVVEPEVARKAPTPLKATSERRSRRERGLFIVLGVCLMLFGISFGIGLSDKGAIDVVAVVNDRNEKINRGEARDASGNTITQTVGVQNQNPEPNGGLILADPSLIPAVVETEPATTTTATSTLDVATTTDEVTATATTSIETPSL